LRDNDKSKYHGKSVFKAIENVNSIIAPQLLKVFLYDIQISNIYYIIFDTENMKTFNKCDIIFKANLEVTQQTDIDNFMLNLDGTPNKSKLGANAILGVSLAVCKAGAQKKGLPLYK